MKSTDKQEKVAEKKDTQKQRREEVLLRLKSGIKAGAGCWGANDQLH